MEPVRASSRADAAFEVLLRAIVTAELAPGERLQEALLADRLGVSRTPVREALRRLHEIDLVRLEVSRQYQVTPIDPRHLRSTVLVAAELAGMVARLAHPLLSTADAEQIRAEGGHVVRGTWSGTPRPSFGAHLLDVLVERLDDPVVARALVPYRPHVARAANVFADRLEREALARWAAGVLAALDEQDGHLLGESVRAYVVQLGEVLVRLATDDLPAAVG